MTSQEINDRLTEVFRKTFENEKLVISRETTARDVENWDSITHLDLITAVEEAFGIEITGFEVMNLKNVGDLMDLLATKLS